MRLPDKTTGEAADPGRYVIVADVSLSRLGGAAPSQQGHPRHRTVATREPISPPGTVVPHVHARAAPAFRVRWIFPLGTADQRGHRVSPFKGYQRPTKPPPHAEWAATAPDAGLAPDALWPRPRRAPANSRCSTPGGPNWLLWAISRVDQPVQRRGIDYV